MERSAYNNISREQVSILSFPSLGVVVSATGNVRVLCALLNCYFLVLSTHDNASILLLNSYFIRSVFDCPYMRHVFDAMGFASETQFLGSAFQASRYSSEMVALDSAISTAQSREGGDNDEVCGVHVCMLLSDP